MKKHFSLLICLALSAFLALGAFALSGENYALFSGKTNVEIPINEHVAGDANGDGTVNIVDAISVLRYSVGNKVNTLRDGVDTNSDGAVNPADVFVIIRHILGDDVGLGVTVNADGSVKAEAESEQSEEIAIEILVAAAVSNGDLSSLEANGEGVFLGWFTSEEAAKSLDVTYVAANDYTGDVFAAFVSTGLGFVGVDMFTDEPYGIRFISKLDKNTVAAIEKVNEANRSGKNATFNPANEWKNGIGYGTALAIDIAVDGVPVKTDRKVVNGGMSVPAVYVYAEDDTAIFFTATVIGVDTAAMADKIAARPYITYKDANGVEHTVYANGASESFYNVTTAVANSETAAESEKTAASALISKYTGSAFTSKSTIAQFNLSSVEGSADNDNAYVELDRTTLVALDGTADDGKTGSDRTGVYRYDNAFYPRITKIKDNLYLMTFNYSQLGRHIYWTTSTDGKTWEIPKVLYSAESAKNKFTYETGSLKGTEDDFIAATADHTVLNDGTVMCVYSRRARNGYGSNEYTGLHTLEVVTGTVSGNTIKWSTPTPVYHGHSWEPEIIQRKNGDIEIYWSHSAPMIDLYGFNDDMRSSGVAMISSSDGGKTWTPSVTADDTNHYAGKRIYQYNAGKFTLDNGNSVNFYHGQMPGVVELVDGRMMVIAETRTTSRSYHMISLARSNKNGTWTELGINEVGPSDVQEDNFKGAAPTLMRFDSGELLVTYNANRSGSNMMFARLLNKTGSDIADAYELNPFYTVSETDSGFWSSSAPIDSHTAILAMSYKKYKGLEPEIIVNEDGTETTELHNTTVIGQVRLNHTINATKKNMVADGNLQEWKGITDALFVGSLSDVQATYRFAYDDDYIYVAIDRTDSSNNAADTNYVMIATADGYVKAEMSYGEYTLPAGVAGGTKNATGGRVYELSFDRAALGLTGEYIRVSPGFTDVKNNADDRINGTLLTDTSSWIKINLK
ncbi:MAG: hypothetical protein E7598_02330 [Ruminococcaceae bacterium]|nr:hypothetical protein [Oscillospiraceae bacterium]